MVNPFTCLAGPMGLEPTPSGVTGRRYNQLNYHPKERGEQKIILLSGLRLVSKTQQAVK